MRTVFVGDVHGCATALRRVLAAARPERVILLGDLFAKGPDPLGVWRIIEETHAESVLGNHDAKMLQVWGQPGEGKHTQACQALPPAARDWMAGLPLFLPGPGWVAVHAGLHPYLGRAGTDRRTALTVRRWPDDTDPATPFWWELYEGAERVIYGHDAIRGVQVHPRTVGLDSGCVYGNVLSAWVLETGELVQAPDEHGGPSPAG
jgi:hypothetical protein